MSLLRWNNPETPSRSMTGRNAVETGTQVLHPPATRDEWVQEYGRRRAVMYGEPYTTEEVVGFQMFRAVDEDAAQYSPQTLPLREAGDIRFVQQVNAQGVFRGGVQLEPAATEDQEVDLEPAEEVWTRSKVGRCSPWWARMLSGMGELALEAVRMDDGAHIVVYDPESVRPEFDTQTGTKLVRVTMVAPFLDPEELDEHGAPKHDVGIMRTYKRVVDAERIDVWVDGKHDEAASGPHGMGEVPFAWVTWDAMPSDPIHGVPSSHGMDGTVARIDSISCQIDAVTKRYANPVPFLRGAKAGGEGKDMFRLGKLVEIPNAQGSLEYLEPDMTGIRVLMELQAQKQDHLSATRPEYIFHGAGAGASGEALKVRAAQYVAKVEEVRGSVFEALLYLTDLAVAMDAGAAPVHGLYSISAPPVLPVDVSARIDALVKAKAAGLHPREVAAELQRLGLIDRAVNPQDYAQEMMDLEAQNALSFGGAFGAPALGGAELLPGEDEDDS